MNVITASNSQSGTPGLIRRLGKALSTPFDPEDYLALFDPLQSAREIRARVIGVQRESDQAVTLTLQPNRLWKGHRAGQHVLLGVEIEGVRHQRCFSLSSAPGGAPTISVKRQGRGGVSDHLVNRCREGDLLTLAEPAGEFVLPDPVPERLLMVTAGSGITPVHSIVKSLLASNFDGKVTWVHFERRYRDLMLSDSLAQLRQGVAQHQVPVAAFEVHPGHFAVEVGREQGLHDTVNRCNPGARGDHQKALRHRVRQHEFAGRFGQGEQVALPATVDQMVADAAPALALHADGGRAAGGRGQGEAALMPHAFDLHAQQNMLTGAVAFPKAVGLQGQGHRLVTLALHADHPGAYFAGGLQRIEQGQIVLRVERRAERLAETTDQARSTGL